MKLGPRLASALVKLVIEERADLGLASDAALEILKNSSPSEISTFPRLVQKELRKSKILRVRVSTPTGTSDIDAHAFAKVAKERTLELSHEKNPALLGGAIVQAGDERLDRSLQTALRELQQALLRPLLAGQPSALRPSGPNG